jgi:hypothetical protein
MLLYKEDENQQALYAPVEVRFAGSIQANVSLNKFEVKVEHTMPAHSDILVASNWVST